MGSRLFLGASCLFWAASAVAAVFSYVDETTFRLNGPVTEVNFDATPCGAPIAAASPGVLAGSTYSSAGVTFAAGVIFDESPYATPPSSPNILSNTGINTPTPSLVDATFSSPVHCVGVTNFGGQAVLRLYDASNTFLGAIRSDSDPATNDFAGACSGTPIKRITYDHMSGIGFGMDNLLFSQIVATPCRASVQIGALAGFVAGLNIQHGIRTSLLAKLQDAINAANNGDIATACADLQAFTNEVSAQAGKKIAQSDASQLVEQAQDIRTALGCS